MGFPPQGVSTQLDFHAMGWKSNGFSEISIGFPRNGAGIPWDFHPMGFPTDFLPMGFPTHGISPPWDFHPMGFPMGFQPHGISTPWDFHPMGFPLPGISTPVGGGRRGTRGREKGEEDTLHVYVYIYIYIDIYVYIYIWGISLGSKSFPTQIVASIQTVLSNAMSATEYILAVPKIRYNSMGELMSTATNAGLVQAGQVDAVLENRWNTVMDPLQWEIQVEQSDGMWWTIPYWLSNPILQELQMATPRISYIWDWKWSNWNNPRKGSYKPDGQTTTINRYIINFDTMYQKNIDKPDKGDRKVKIVSVIR